MRTVIVGGGVIGLACAWALHRESDVTVIDAGRLGYGASFGNAGWVTRSLSAPLPGPGVVRQAARWMLDRDSPLLVRPRLDPSFFRWAWHFMRNCRPDVHDAGLAATLALGDATARAYDEMAADGIAFERHQTGLLFLALTDKGVREHDAMTSSLRAVGYRGALTRLASDELRQLEPGISSAVVDAVHAEDDWHVDPLGLCESLAEWLPGVGVALQPFTVAERIVPDGAGWRVGLRDGTTMRADRVLVAAGAWSGQVLRRTAVELLMEPAKGYSLTGRMDSGPRHALYMSEAKLGYSTYADRSRIAGTLELSGFDESLNRRRLRALEAAAVRYLPGWRIEGAQPWTGFRPATPDGLPYIGETAQPGLFVATGHGTLGVSLAAGTATAIADAMRGERVPVLDPFRPNRRHSPPGLRLSSRRNGTR